MRKFILALAMASLFIVGGAIAQDSVLRPGHPDRYIVKEGDTLWGIAGMFLNDAWQWPEIWYVNPEIENPHLIFPGDEIILIYVDGEPQLTVRRAPALVRLPRDDVPVERLVPAIRSERITSAIPAIPLDAIAHFLTAGRIVGPNTLDEAPHIVAGETRRLVFGTGDKLYARGEWTDVNPVYGVFRHGDVYQDPETKEVLGYEAREVGLARVLARNDDLATLRLTSVRQEVRIGDRLLPTEERRVESTFYPAAPERDVKGVIMTVLGGATFAGRNDVIAVNRGSTNGLDVGHVLAIFKSGSTVRDQVTNELVQLPDERVGLLMVFRSFEKMAYGLVLTTEDSLRVGDSVANP